jgi:antitoxin component YwqK of YwqJK toxin-antitoxin module
VPSFARDPSAPIARDPEFVHNNDVVRLHTVVCILTSAAACGSGPSTPKAAPQEPPPPPIIAQPVVVDAAVPDAPEPPKLTCDDGTVAVPARAPEPTLYCTRPDGTRHGPFITTYPDGSPHITGSYKDGALDGPWQRYGTSGAVLEAGTHAAGQKSGRWQMTSSLGALLGTYDMRAGTGTELHWLDDGTLYSERSLKAGIKSGPERIYAPEGTPLVSQQWVAGKLDGPRAAGTRATLRLEEIYAAGVRRGNRQIWQSQQLLLDENYDKRGKLDGDYTIWRNKKVARVHGQYEHGKRDGLWVWSDRDANKEREGNYLDGKRDGPWTEWFENKIVFTGHYTRGKPDGEFIYYDRNENELGRFDIKDGTGTMLTFWPNKKVASRQHYYQGAADGLYQELTKEGKVVVEGRFRGDQRHGIWRELTPEGIPTLEQSWKRGRLDGPVTKYVDGVIATQATFKEGKATGPYAELRAGKPAVTGQFTDDRRTGTWTEYDAEGRVTLTASYKDGVLDGMWRQMVDGIVVEGSLTQGRRTGTWTRTDKAGVVRQLTYPSL